jgi:hypothetical protein
VAVVAVVAFWLAQSMIDVGSDGDCPAAADVQTRLDALAGARARSTPGYRARLERRGTDLHLELSDPEGRAVAERDLPGGNASCGELASAAAVVVASWAAEVGPHIDLRPEIPTPAPAPPRSSALPAAVVSSPALAPPPGPTAPTDFGVGIGILASLTGGDLAGGAEIDAVVSPRGGRLGLALGLSATSNRAQAVDPAPAEARWMRASLLAGPRFALRLAPPVIDLRVQAVAALLHVQGAGLPVTASDNSGQLGACVGLRAGWPWGTAEPWVGIDLLAWPGHERLVVNGPVIQHELPRLEVQVALGLSLGRSP